MPERATLYKWALLLVAAMAMGAVGSYQFIWSSIRPVIGTQLNASEQVLGSVFTVFIVCQTVSQLPAGWFRDRFGPRLPLAIGTVGITGGYLGAAYATASWHVVLAYAVGGIGAGATYTVAVNTPVKWFGDRRGLATGVVVMAYGGVSFLFIPFVREGITADFTGTMLTVAVLMGGVTLLGALVLRDPERDRDDATEVGAEDAAAYTWRQAVHTWQFWLLYAMLVVINAVGLMVIGKAVAYAEQFGMAAIVVTITASVVSFSDSLGGVVVGGLSDRFGRERTIAATVTLSGLATGLSVGAGQAEVGVLFALFVGAAVFFRAPVFAITPSLVGEYYGTARSSENYAALYTSKVWGGVGGGVVASTLIGSIGWTNAFLFGGGVLTVMGLLMTRLQPVEQGPTTDRDGTTAAAD